MIALIFPWLCIYSTFSRLKARLEKSLGTAAIAGIRKIAAV
jgi:precorrin-2 methylase